MVTSFSASKIYPHPTEATSWETCFCSMLLLPIEERDALVTEITDLLDSPDRAEVFRVLTVAGLRHFALPAPRDYEFFSEFQKACNEIKRFHNALGIVQGSKDGKLIDRNDLHRPLTASGDYYVNEP